MIAAQSTATAAPDGYTIQMANSGHVIAGQLSKNLNFDVVRDFAGIAMVGEAPAVVVVSPNINVKNLQDDLGAMMRGALEILTADGCALVGGAAFHNSL